MNEFVPLEHPRFHKVDCSIFLERIAPDCMNFQCCLVKHSGRVKLDACCQYGVDTDLDERDGILAHRAEIARLLRSEVRDLPWFSEVERVDPDFPSGKLVRTHKHDGGCIFLGHDRRGCAIHRAAIEGGWDFRGIKPHVCRLFPLSYDDESILFSDDYEDYSCALVASAPTVYRTQREDLGDIFGLDLVEALDAAEAVATARRQLVCAC